MSRALASLLHVCTFACLSPTLAFGAKTPPDPWQALPPAVKRLPRHTRALVFSRRGLIPPPAAAVWQILLSTLAPEERQAAERIAQDINGPVFLAVTETGYHNLDHVVFLFAAELPRVRERWRELGQRWEPILKRLDLKLLDDIALGQPILSGRQRVGFISASEDWVFVSNVEALAKAAAIGKPCENGGLLANPIIAQLKTKADPSADLVLFADLNPLWQLVASQPSWAKPEGIVCLLVQSLCLSELDGFIGCATPSSVQFAAATRGEHRGLLRLVCQRPRACPLLARVPSECQLIARVAMDSAGDFAVAYREITGRIDSDIASEFDRELVEFARDSGVDLQKQVLSNLADECVLALEFVPAKGPKDRPSVKPLLLTHVGDREELQAALEKLIARLDKPAKREARERGLVYSRDMGLPFRAIGLSDEVFVLAASEAEAWEALGREAQDSTALGKLGADLMKRPTSAFIVMPSIAGVAKTFGMAMRPAPSSPAGTDTSTGVALWATCEGNAIQGEFQAGEALLAFVPQAAASGIVAARASARGKQCMSNLKQIGLACAMYAEDHKGELPATLQALKPYVNTDQFFKCPVTRMPYQYLGAGRRFGKPQNAVLARDAKPHPNGFRCLLYMDGHVAQVREHRAGKARK